MAKQTTAAEGNSLSFDFGTELADAFGGGLNEAGGATSLEEVQSNPVPDIQVIDGDDQSFQAFLKTPQKQTLTPPAKTEQEGGDQNTITIDESLEEKIKKELEAEDKFFDDILEESGIPRISTPSSKEKKPQTPTDEEGNETKVDLPDDPSGQDAAFYKQFAKDLVEGNVLAEVSDEDLEKVQDYKDIIALQENEIVAETDRRLERMMQDLDPDAAAFLRFKANGGDTKEFFSVFKQQAGRPTGDMENEAVQEAWLDYYLTNYRNSSTEETAMWIEAVKAKGQTKQWAQKFQAHANQEDQKRQAEISKQAEEAKRQKAEDARTFANTVNKLLEGDNVNGISLNRRYARKLQDVIFGVDKKTGASKLHTELGKALSSKNEDKMLVLAALVEADFDVSKLVPKLKKQAAAKVKKEIEETRRVPSVRTAGGARDSSNKTLADFFSTN